MNWHEKMNAAVDYIEENLTGAIDILEAARLARCSEYHFRRMFSFVAGVPVSEYIRRRRLTLAAQELQQTKGTVEDIARKYGYSSPDAFTRAFQAVHGINPSQAKVKHSLKAWPRMTFYLTIQGGIEMDYRIEEKPAFNFAGVSKRVPMQFEGVNQEIVKLAESITKEQREEMRRLQNTEPYEIVNVSYDADAGFMKEEGDLTHLIGVLTTSNQVSDRLDKVPVEACTWAVFPNEGPFPATLQETMAKTYSEWLPSSHYEVIDAPTFSFTKMSKDKKDYAYSEVWIPVKESR